MIEIPFLKMQAQGNDYIYLDYFENNYPELDYTELSRGVSHRRFGIGSDGLVTIKPLADNEYADAEMRIFNSDGSEALMCGSALRSVVYLLKDKFPQREKFTVKTLSGDKSGIILENGAVKCNMGKPFFISDEQIEISECKGYAINVGNPHFVVFEIPFGKNFKEIAPKIAVDNFFKTGTNVEYLESVTDKSLTIKIWERGSGETFACGTGAVASAFAVMKASKTDKSIQINMPGGSVIVEKCKETFFLTGSVNKTARGVFFWEKN
ncbi:MAG: diaminopimelate epimerase [Candidatus Cloacimonetes bacterium]|nr:diaminopimelate epimerase [Candidatus Cloacimonadota bacterium]